MALGSGNVGITVGTGGTYTSSWSYGEATGIRKPAVAPPPAAPVAPPVAPVTPTYDPKIEANALYGKRMVLFAGGLARIGSAPAPIVGPYINAGQVSFMVSFGVAVPIAGTRVIYDIYLDNEKAWTSPGGGTVPGDGTFAAEAFDFTFYPGRLDQAVDTLETTNFPGTGNQVAYRPQMLLSIRNIPFQRFLDRGGKPVPYVSCLIGDTTDGADPHDGINVGTALERVAHSPWAGYDADTFEAVGITDVCGALLISQDFSIIELCQTVTRVYRNMDLLQSDKLRIKDRGSNLTPNLILDRNRIVADQSIQINRTGPSEQPRELELSTVDPDQDYTIVTSLAKRMRDPVPVSAAVGKQTIALPLVLDANTRQSMVTFAQYYEENARKKFAFSVLAYGLGAEPGDLVRLSDIADGVGDEIVKLTSTLHGANYVIECEAESTLRCSLADEEATDPYIDYVVLLQGYEGAQIIDESSYARTMDNDGTGGAVSDQAKFGSYSYFGDGNQDGLNATALEHPDFVFTGPFTIEAFIRFHTLSSTTKAIVACWLPVLNGGNWQLTVVGTISPVLTFQWATGASTSTSVTSAAVFVTNTWYHVAADRDASNVVRIYLDGVMLASATIAGTSIAGQRVRVGMNGGGGSSSFLGWIDEVRVTNGINRYGGASFTVPTAAFPRT